MQVHFTPEQEAQLLQIANHNGFAAEDLVKIAALQLLEEDAQFRASIRKGLAEADRGELLDHDQVVRNIEQFLNGK